MVHARNQKRLVEPPLTAEAHHLLDKDRLLLVVEASEQRLGRLDHIAFAATDVDGVRKRLQSKNVKFRESIVPRTGDTQFFMYDPDGVGVELNFPKS